MCHWCNCLITLPPTAVNQLTEYTCSADGQPVGPQGTRGRQEVE